MNIFEKVQLWRNGFVFLRYERKKGWKNAMPIFVARCPEHGLYETQLRGRGYARCPKCLYERFVGSNKVGRSENGN